MTLDPSMPLSVHIAEALSQALTNDQADQHCRAIAEAHFAGHYDERETREAILVIVWAQNVHERSVDQYGVPANERDEIVAKVSTDLVQIMLDPKGYDLTRALEKSVCAFVRVRARNTAMSKTRDYRRMVAREGSPSDPTALSFTAAATYEQEPFVSTAEIDKHYQAVEDFSTVAQNVRGLSRIRVGATHAYGFYGVALAVRPKDIVEREAAWALIRDDASLAYRSLRAFYADVYEGDPRAVATIPDEISSLWLDMSREDLESLLDTHPAYTHAIAVDAVGPWARPAQRDIQRYRTRLADLRKGDLKWRALTQGLAAAFVDHEFQAVSAFDTGAACGAADSKAPRLSALVTRAVDFEGQPTGLDPAAVRATLFRMAAEHLGSPDLARFADQSAAAA